MRAEEAKYDGGHHILRYIPLSTFDMVSLPAVPALGQSSLTHSHSLSRSHTHSPTLPHSSTHSPTLSHTNTHALTLNVSHSLTLPHSLTHDLTHSHVLRYIPLSTFAMQSLPGIPALGLSALSHSPCLTLLHTFSRTISHTLSLSHTHSLSRQDSRNDDAARGLQAVPGL